MISSTNSALSPHHGRPIGTRHALGSYQTAPGEKRVSIYQRRSAVSVDFFRTLYGQGFRRHVPFAEAKGVKKFYREGRPSAEQYGDEMNNLNAGKKLIADDRDQEARWTATDGIQVNELAQYDVLSITTANNSFQVTVIDPETALVRVRGGNY